MKLFKKMARYAAALRQLMAPHYHPERHYMRGPGPACARRGHNGQAHA